MIAHELLGVIGDALLVRAQTANRGVIEAVGRLEQLPSAPHLHEEVARAVRSPHCSTADIAAVIERDPALATRVLHIANSGLFRGAHPPLGLSTAIARLGLQVVVEIVLAAEVMGAFSLPLPELNAAIDHGVEVVRLARALLRQPEERDLAYTAGLLHDVGTLVVRLQGQEHLDAIAAHRQSGMSALQAEVAVLGVDHAQIGAYLLELWGLPDRVVSAVRHHPAPDLWHEEPVCAAVGAANQVDERQHSDALDHWPTCAQAWVDDALRVALGLNAKGDGPC